MVSTDSKEYGTIAANAGAEVMYRCEKVSDDTATTYMVLEDLFNRSGSVCDCFVLSQPISPMQKK